MFDIKTVPPITIRPGKSGNVEIIDNETISLLLIDGKQYMVAKKKTDTEIRELYSSYDLAKGDVLITGFGFGILALWLASKPEVTSVKVLDWSQDVVDLFLRNNKLPDNVSVEIVDAKNYKTDKFYDCILLDHFQDGVPPTPEELQQISSNIPNHNLMWFWSLENRLLVEYHLKELTAGRYCQVDPMQHWEDFKNKYKLKFPELSKEKLTEYVGTWFRCKDYLPR